MGKSLERRFEEYGEVIGAALAHADRRMPAQWYLRGLMLPGGRKSVEPMAARVQPHKCTLGPSVDASSGGGCQLE